MTRFKAITNKNSNLNDIIKDNEVSGLVMRGKEKVFEVNLNGSSKEKNDNYIDIEIALRKCKRVGVFSK